MSRSASVDAAAARKKLVQKMGGVDDEDAKRRARPANDGPVVQLSEEEMMQQMLGFGSFSTTKDSEVADNHTSASRGAVKKNQNRLYRQYMNRRGGFNRPLDKVN